MIGILRTGLILLTLGSVAACQMTASDSGPSNDLATARISFPSFYNPGDDLKGMLAQSDNVTHALDLVDREWAFFQNSETKAKYAALLGKVAHTVNQRHAPVMEKAGAALAAIEWPTPQSRWPSVKNAIDRAQAASAAYPKSRLLASQAHRSPALMQLEARLKSLTTAIAVAAPGQFVAFPHSKAANFFDAYPMRLNGDALHAQDQEALARFIGQQTRGQLKSLAEVYDHRTLGSGLWARMGDRYADLSAATLPRGLGSPLRRTLAQAAARNAGFGPGMASGLKVAFVDATSKTLLTSGEIDFSAEIDLDLPVETSTDSLDKTVASAGPGAPDLIIIFQIVVAKASRRVVELTQIPSTLFVGFSRFGATTTANVSANLQSAKPSNGVVAPDDIGQNRNVIGQPKALGDPVMAAYHYDKARIIARKNMTVRYYVIDRRRNAYLSSLFDAHELDRFEVAYRIDANDPRRPRLTQQYDQEKDVDAFEKAGIKIRLSQLLTDYAQKIITEKPFASETALRRRILADRNRALTKVKANTFDARPLNDPRFDSVVAVYVGKASMGSGFYVMPNVILTNWHVVENARFVEMKLYDGQETFGTVLGRDARLDLALIRVEHRGKPVRFRTDTKLDLGATVEVIGHPLRNLFSITRGGISAVRKEYSINLPKHAGDKVLFIQTDAPINSGNSGGPLFLGDHVVGINTWGYLTDGLSFAVHYSEVLAYLREHLPGFQVIN